jgi:hypothetical protein
MIILGKLLSILALAVPEIEIIENSGVVCAGTPAA